MVGEARGICFRWWSGGMTERDKARRKALRDNFKRRYRERERSRLHLSNQQLDGLLGYLDEGLGRVPCDRTHGMTMQWARASGVDDVRLQGELLDLVQGCDCEVLANLDPETMS